MKPKIKIENEKVINAFTDKHIVGHARSRLEPTINLPM
jgi:hypothetical protein